MIENQKHIEVHKPVSVSAEEIYPSLGLAKSSKEVIQAANQGFEWKHLGNSNIKFSTLYNWLQNFKNHINAPRSAHLGGAWEAIAKGGGGQVMFNRGVLELGIGYPFLLDINVTPNGNPKESDMLYYPGSILDKDNRLKHLTLYTFQSGEFKKAQKQGVYSPFAVTRVEDKFYAINQIHKIRSSQLEGVKYVSKVFVESWERVYSFLAAYTSRVLLEDSPQERQKLFSRIINRWVTQQGSISSARFTVENPGIKYEGKFYKWQNFFNLLKESFLMAAYPEQLTERLPAITDGVPGLSKEMLILTMAFLDVDFTPSTKTKGNVNPHFHWGGFQMAGLGTSNGYFKDSTNTLRTISRLIQIGFEKNPELNTTGFEYKPIAYTLMPASIFLLLPHQNNKKELEAVSTLLQEVQKMPYKIKSQKGDSQNFIREVVNSWTIRNYNNLSAPFLSRFAENTDSLVIFPEDPSLSVPDDFYELGLQELTILTGILKQKFCNI